MHGPLPDTKTKAPLILEIKGNSLDDGPGIRSVVFFKGCPLSCVWCHNPESQKTGPELAFDSKKCVGCGTCLDTCTRGALSKDNPGYIDRTKCDLCFECPDACPSGALEKVGREISLGEILEKVLRDKPFYDASGGGVTLSGGEPSLPMDSVSQLLQGLKNAGVQTLMETCGLFRWEAFKEKLLPYLDKIYFDLKVMDEEGHKKYCGVSNKTILENFLRLLHASRKTGFELLPRMPLVPGITATEENVAAAAAFLQKNKASRIRLLPYNPLWPEKTEKIGAENPIAHEECMQKWMPAEEVERLEDICRKHGLETSQ